MAVLLLRQAPVGIILSGRGCRAERLADFQILLRFSKLRNCSFFNQKMFMQISNLSLQIFPLRYNKTKSKLLQYKNPMDSMVLDRREIALFYCRKQTEERESGMKINRCMKCMKETDRYPCPHCGYDGQPQPDYALRQGTILNGKYLVGCVLGQGGFGLTYVGLDLSLDRKVAIKEYYPNGSVVRAGATSSFLVWGSNERSVQLRQDGMDAFLREARKMAKVDDISGVVRVREQFRENDTAYIVMDFAEGETLKSLLNKTGPLPWERAKKIFLPALETLAQVHEAGIIHRDLSPDNLMVTPEGNVKILDLGAAKDLSVNSGASSMVVAKGGFSPWEQYTQRGGSGPWTDVYAMAATMYYALTGVLPPTAIDRMNGDQMQWDLPQLQALPGNVQSVLRKALSVPVKDRYGSAAELLAALKASMAAPAAGKAAVKSPKPKPPWGVLLLSAVLMAGIVYGFTHCWFGHSWQDGVCGKCGVFESEKPAQAEPASSKPPLPADDPQKYAVGDVVTFGSYPQTQSGTDNTPIEWQVLDIQDGKALLISKYALDCQPYNVSGMAVTWETCSLRTWLNETFLNSAFRSDEAGMILKTTVTADQNPRYLKDAGRSTQDWIFLLSVPEAEQYLASDDVRQCRATYFAKAQGAYISTKKNCWWWLRTPGYLGSSAACVSSTGLVNYNGTAVNYMRGSVRPAMWVNLDADIEVTETGTSRTNPITIVG